MFTAFKEENFHGNVKKKKKTKNNSYLVSFQLIEIANP